MPSFHIRARDHRLIPCRDEHGRPLEACRLHGDLDIKAESLEEAYRIMESQSPRPVGLSSPPLQERRMWNSILPLLPETRPIPRLEGAGRVVSSLLGA